MSKKPSSLIGCPSHDATNDVIVPSRDDHFWRWIEEDMIIILTLQPEREKQMFSM